MLMWNFRTFPQNVYNVSTTGSNNPDEVLSDLRRALMNKGIQCSQKGWVVYSCQCADSVGTRPDDSSADLRPGDTSDANVDSSDTQPNVNSIDTRRDVNSTDTRRDDHSTDTLLSIRNLNSAIILRSVNSDHQETISSSLEQLHSNNYKALSSPHFGNTAYRAADSRCDEQTGILILNNNDTRIWCVNQCCDFVENVLVDWKTFWEENCSLLPRDENHYSCRGFLVNFCQCSNENSEKLRNFLEVCHRKIGFEDLHGQSATVFHVTADTSVIVPMEETNYCDYSTDFSHLKRALLGTAVTAVVVVMFSLSLCWNRSCVIIIRRILAGYSVQISTTSTTKFTQMNGIKLVKYCFKKISYLVNWVMFSE